MSNNNSASPLVRLVGALGILMVATGVVVAVVQALRPDARTEDGEIPAITLLAPLQGDTVSAPIIAHFRAGDRLELGPMGWASDDLHLHAYVDSVEVMPAAADIEVNADGTYTWHIPAESGAHSLQLSWAGMHHGSITAGASEVVHIVVR